MPAHDPFRDAVLGVVTWNDATHEWEFSVPIADRGMVSGRIVFEDWQAPLVQPRFAAIRQRVRGICENELALRQQVADRSFEGWWLHWYDEEIDEVTTKDAFRDVICLAAIDILEDGLPFLTYADGNLFGGHALMVSLGPSCEIIGGPDLWG